MFHDMLGMIFGSKQMPVLEKQTDTDLAAMFKALGDPTRLTIFNFLRDQCCPVAVDDTGDAAGLGADRGRSVLSGDRSRPDQLHDFTSPQRTAPRRTYHHRAARQEHDLRINQDALSALAEYFSGDAPKEAVLLMPTPTLPPRSFLASGGRMLSPFPPREGLGVGTLKETKP